MKHFQRCILSLLTILPLLTTAEAAPYESGLEPGKPVTNKERLPLTHAPTSPTIQVPVVEELDEPEMPEASIPQPIPPKPPTPPKVQAGEPKTTSSPVDQAIQFMDQIRKETPNLLKAPIEPPATTNTKSTTNVVNNDSPTTKQEKPAPESPKAPPPPTADATTDKKGYLVQVGAMSQVENALSLVEKCQEKGFPAFHQPPDELGGLHRILIGPYASKTEADEIALKWRGIFKGKTLIQKK